MTYKNNIRSVKENPAKLESLYREAIRENKLEQFTQDITECYQEEPQNQLLSAWYFRFQDKLPIDEPFRKGFYKFHNYKLGIILPLSFINAILFWLLTDKRLSFPGNETPMLILFWSPIISLIVISYIIMATRIIPKHTIIVAILLILVSGFAFIFAYENENYLVLSSVHIPILSWAATGISILGFHSDPDQRFKFLIKSIEVFVTMGLFLIAGIIFGLITLGMFMALSIQLPEMILRLIAAGGAGLIPIFAIAIIYDPSKPISEQDFSQGLGKLVEILPRLLLPLTLGVLIVYLVVIPFYFLAPFQNRDVLIVFNLLLFAVMGLIIGATPKNEDDLSPRTKNILRMEILSVLILVVIVSLYALSATTYRTILGGLTMNRLTILGWNVLNIGLFIMMIIQVIQKRIEKWVQAIQSVINLACKCYVIWVLFLLLTMAWLF